MLICKYDLDLMRKPMTIEHDYADFVPLPGPSLSLHKRATLTYIAGYVVKVVCRTIHCEDCIDALTGDQYFGADTEK